MTDQKERARSKIARDMPDAKGFAELLEGTDLFSATWITAAWCDGRPRQYRDLLVVLDDLVTHAYRRGVRNQAEARAHVEEGRG